MPGAKPIVGRAWPLSPLAIDHIATVADCDYQTASLALQAALLDGSVRAQGPLSGLNAEPIEREFWRYAPPSPDGGVSDVVSAFVGRRLAWFEVCAADVLAIWPSPPGVRSRRKHTPPDFDGAGLLRRPPGSEIRTEFEKWSVALPEWPSKIAADKWAKSRGYSTAVVRKLHSASTPRAQGRPQKKAG